MAKYISITLILFFISCTKHEPAPKNIILFIGDGMGVSQVSALKTVTAQPNLGRFKTAGLLTTHSSDNYVTDSGAGATALSTGYKTYNKAISVSEKKRYIKNCT